MTREAFVDLTAGAAMPTETDPAAGLQLTSVHYSRLHSLGNYENEKIGATARVADGEDAGEVFTALVAWVSDRIGQGDERDTLIEHVHDLQNTAMTMERRIAQAKDAWSRYLAFCTKIGVSVPSEILGDMPF